MSVERRITATGYWPGSFYPEEASRRVERWGDVAEARTALDGLIYKSVPFAIEWAEIEGGTLTDDQGLEHRLADVTVRKSGRTYIGGETYSVDRLRAMAAEDPDQYRILLLNVEGNGYASAVLTPAGNWQFLEPDDRVVPV